jgi:alginate O-acetyltransferase complex protein AlgI
MIFSDLFFLILLCVTIPLFFSVPNRYRDHVITFSGIIFYSYYGHLWVLIFFSELLISRFYKESCWTCWLGVVQALIVLVIFKYGFFIESNLRFFIGLKYVQQSAWFPTTSVIPLAISFFTFEFAHYAIDSYRGDIQNRSFIKYASFIFFFPTLVAGPIKRFQHFNPKVQTASFAWANLQFGITRILLGFFKKFVIADSMVGWTIRLAHENIQSMSPLALWEATFAYGFRIFFDFSGYSDIAIGSALLLGISIPENFKFPYLKRNISEFWKHWHISLYSWLVDYIFIPLGGNRISLIKTYSNIMIVTTFSALWHGASWNFIFWGWYHGILLCCYHTIQKLRLIPNQLTGLISYCWKGFSIGITFFLVMFGWTFFAVKSEDLYSLFRTMFSII